MKPLIKILIAAGLAELLIIGEVDPLTFIIIYVLAIVFVQVNDYFEIRRGQDRRPTAAWRSRYSRRRTH